MSVTFRKFACSASALALAMPLAIQSAHAAAESDDNGGFSDIIVTAQRRSENLQDVPIAVSAQTAESLADAGVDAGASLPRVTPGLALNTGSGFYSPYIRGVGTQYANLGLESSVATYFDDQYMSRPVAGFYSFNDIERIEVLKGPQGTLYGRNAAAGAIRIITRDPQEDFSAHVGIGYGRFNRWMAEATINLPVTNGIYTRWSVDYDKRDGFVKNLTTGRKMEDRDVLMLRNKTLFELADNFTAKLSLDYAEKDDSEGVTFINVFNAPVQMGEAFGGSTRTGFYTTTINGYTASNSNYGRFDTWRPYIRVRQAGAQLRLDYEADGVNIASITGWRWSKMDEATDLDATSLALQHCYFYESSNSYSQELQLSSTGEGPLKWVAGLYYFKEKGSNEFDVFGIGVDATIPMTSGPNVGGYAGGATLNAIGHVSIEAFAPYAELSYRISDQIEFAVGARYSWEAKELTRNRVFMTGLGPNPVPVYAEDGTRVSFSEFTPRAVLSYRPVDDVLLYLSYSKGFKSGGINTPAFGPAGLVEPETLDSFEFGWKLDFDRVRFNGSIFDYDYKNLQVQRVDVASGGSFVENAASARIRGIEGELTVLPADGLELGVGATYLHTKFKQFDGEAYVPASGTAACTLNGGLACLGLVGVARNFDGDRLPLAPKLSGFARAGYKTDLGSAGSLKASVIASYSGKYNYNPEALMVEPKRTLVSASLGWTSPDERYSLTLFGDNIFAKKYYTLKAVLGTGGYSIVGAPATWGIKAAVDF